MVAGQTMSRILMKPPKLVSRIYLRLIRPPTFPSRQVRNLTATFFAASGERERKKKRRSDTRAIFEISKGSIPRDNLGRYFSGLIPLWHDKNVISIDHRRPFPSVLPRSLSRS